MREIIMQNDKTELTKYLVKIENVEPSWLLQKGPLLVSLVSFLIPLVLAIMQYRLAKKQKEQEIKQIEKQNEISERQLSIALYERRYDIYKRGKNLLLSVYKNKGMETEDLEIIKQITTESQFLFIENITNMQYRQFDIFVLYQDINNLKKQCEKINNIIKSQMKIENVNNEVLTNSRRDYMNSLSKDIENSIKLAIESGLIEFKKYLDEVENLKYNINDIDAIIENIKHDCEMLILNMVRSYDEEFKPYLDFKNIK